MKRYIAPVMLMVVLSGCKKTPEGDVIAVVNGDEITRPELDAAMPQVPAGTDPKLARKVALNQLINERLMVQGAKADGLDKSQDYILKSRSADNLLLASMFAGETAAQVGQTEVYKADAYIEANPSRFAKRVVLAVDQIKVPRQNVMDDWLKDAKSLDEVAQILTAHNVAFQRGRASIDSFVLESADYAKIAAVPMGRPFAVVENGTLVLTSKLSEQPAPATGEDARRAAIAMLQQKVAQQGLQKRVGALRASAKIDYQPGFELPAAKAAPKP